MSLSLWLSKNRQNRVLRFSGLFLFTVGFLVLCGIEFNDAIFILSVVSVQFYFGGSIWRRVRGASLVSETEFLGMGGAVGFSLSLISSQLFRELAPQAVSWLLLPLGLHLILNLFFGRRDRIIQQRSESKTQEQVNLKIPILIGGTLLALSSSWYWLIPSAVTFAGFVMWFLLRKTFMAFGQTYYLPFCACLIPLGIYALRIATDLAQIETIRNPLWWTLRRGVIEDPDLIFNESMINSVQKFGVSDNIFISGFPIQYHWLSFAWESTLGSLRDLQPFAISAIAAPVFVHFVIMCLIYLITENLSSNRYAPVVSVTLAAMMCASPISLLQFLNLSSFSYSFSVLFIFAIIYLLAISNFVISRNELVVFALFSFVAVGSKISNFLPLAFGFGFTFLISLITKFRRREVFVLNLIFGLSVSMFWFFGFKSEEPIRSEGIRLDFGEIFVQKADVSWSSSFFELIFAFGSVTLAILYSVSGLLLKDADIWHSRKLLAHFVLSAGFSGLLMSFIFTDANESSGYLMGVGLAFLVPASVSSTCNWWTKNGASKQIIFVSAVISGIASAQVWDYLYDTLDPTSPTRLVRQSLILLIPLLVAIFISMLVSVVVPKQRKILWPVVLVVSLLASTGGIYLANAKEFHRISVSDRGGSIEISRLMVGSTEYRVLLNWLERHSDSDDLVATNRQCLNLDRDQKSCLLLWSLTSAIANRQNLIEGMYPPRTGYLATERERRWNAVIGFVNNPADQNRDALIKYGVKWVVADHAITDTRNWEPFATERFKNLAGSILELNP